MDVTIQMWRYDWIQQGRSEGTIKTMVREIQRFQEWLSAPLESATVSLCLQYLAERRETVSKYAAEYSWRSMRSYYAFAADLDDSVSPMAKIRCPRRDEVPTKGVNADEYKAITATCSTKDFADVRDRAILAMLRASGMRRGEIANVKLDDINLDQGFVLVVKSKTGKPRFAPLDHDARMSLVKYLRRRMTHRDASSPFLWLGVRGPLSKDGVRLLVQRRAREAGVDVTAHMFRRSFAASFLDNGGSQASLMALAGWSSPAMVVKYTRHVANEIGLREYRRLYGG